MSEVRETTAERVEEVLAELRAGVRQRRSAVAARTAGREQELADGLALEAEVAVREPLCTSALPGVGRLVVLARKAVFHAFLKWYLRPVLAQQNRANQLLAQRLAALTAAQRALRQELGELRQRVDAVAARTPQADGEVAGDGA